MDSIVSTFHIDWKIIIAQVLNFSIVFTMLYIYALKPLSKLMKERGEKIAKGVDDAEENAQILEKTNIEYEKVLVKAKTEAQILFNNTIKEAEIKKDEMLEKAKSDVAIMISDGKKTLEAEKTKMVADAKNEIVSLVMKVTEKLIDKKLDASFDEKTIKELSNL